MKAITFLVAASAVPGTVADFWLSYISKTARTRDLNGDKSGLAILRDPNIICDWSAFTVIWPNSGDVSGDKKGMRCVPGNDKGSPLYRDPLEIVEFNTMSTDVGHQTIYKDRGYAMVDLDGKKTGQCHLNRSFIYDYECWPLGVHVTLKGSSMFFCESSINP
ncbi:hypothetical protein F4677DRAFT_191449 [Hypoxylon crocopeplum]|nr:hypothetical protein F4677DRAFT_191449 [Hypoxylon crocopeplum]